MAAPRSHRRDFLKGKAAARAVEHLAAQSVEGLAGALPASMPPHYLVKYSRRAMACQFEIWLNSGQYAHGSATAMESLDLVDQLEQQLSVYRDSSEICELNRIAEESPLEVETRLFDLLQRSVELWRSTDGAFDVTAGPLSELWGFKRREGRLPGLVEIAETLSHIGSQHLELDSENRTIGFLRAGVEINLGGIGKGYALDRCAEVFSAASITSYLFHGGNSSVLARGNNAGRADGGWSIGVRNPRTPECYLGELILRDRALSTSGSEAQHFIHEGRRYGHILDPRTGWPADGVLSTTVIAPTAAEAEALSTAFYVLGPEATQRWCENRTDVACLMLCPGSTAERIITHSFNLTQDIWQPHSIDAAAES